MINNVFAYKQSMYQIRTNYDQSKSTFKDITILGNFVDNHDNERFLHK